MPLPWHLEVWLGQEYWLHDPEGTGVVLGLLELLVEDHVFTRQQERRWQEVVLVRLLLVVLLVQSSLVLLQVLVQHVFPAQLEPASEVVDAHVGQDTMFFEDPVDLFLLTPDDVPVVVPGLPPFPVLESFVHCVLERSLELYVRTIST